MINKEMNILKKHKIQQIILNSVVVLLFRYTTEKPKIVCVCDDFLSIISEICCRYVKLTDNNMSSHFAA